MKITSPAFEHNQLVPVRFTCQGPNINPPLAFADIPAEAQSLVLIVEDVDAPANPWVHWLVFNIPPSTREVPQGAIPKGGTEGLANGNTFGYEGPCPKYFTGTHHYHFKLYALDSPLALPAESNRDAVLPAMRNHVLAEAQLIGLAEGDGSAL